MNGTEAPESPEKKVEYTVEGLNALCLMAKVTPNRTNRRKMAKLISKKKP